MNGNDEELSEYEKERLKRVDDNRKYLLELGILNTTVPKSSGLKNNSEKAPKRRRSAAPAFIPRRIVTRRSVQSGDIFEQNGESDSDYTPKKKKEYRENFYGAVAGVKIGQCWEYRIDCSLAGIHRPTVAGIHGGPDGAYSIALSGGYEDDIDCGYHFTYTGAGGRDLKGTKNNPKNLRTAPQSKNQTADGLNAALIASTQTNNPVRVIRGYKLNSLYAPESGYRYDGLYKVDKYWTEAGLSGFLVYKFSLSRLKDQDPPPWESEDNQENDNNLENCQKDENIQVNINASPKVEDKDLKLKNLSSPKKSVQSSPVKNSMAVESKNLSTITTVVEENHSPDKNSPTITTIVEENNSPVKNSSTITNVVKKNNSPAKKIPQVEDSQLSEKVFLQKEKSQTQCNGFVNNSIKNTNTTSALKKSPSKTVKKLSDFDFCSSPNSNNIRKTSSLLTNGHLSPSEEQKIISKVSPQKTKKTLPVKSPNKIFSPPKVGVEKTPTCTPIKRTGQDNCPLSSKKSTPETKIKTSSGTKPKISPKFSVPCTPATSPSENKSPNSASKNSSTKTHSSKKNDPASMNGNAVRRKSLTVRKNAKSPQSAKKSPAREISNVDETFSLSKSGLNEVRKKGKPSNTLDRYFTKKFASNDLSRSYNQVNYSKNVYNDSDESDDDSPAFIGFNEITVNSSRNKLKLLSHFLPSIVKKQKYRSKLSQFQKVNKTPEFKSKCSATKREYITSIEKIRNLSAKISNFSNYDPNAGFIPKCFIKCSKIDMNQMPIFCKESDSSVEENTKQIVPNTESNIEEFSNSGSPKKGLSPQKLLDLVSSDEDDEEPFLGFNSVSKRSIVLNGFLIQKYAKLTDNKLV